MPSASDNTPLTERVPPQAQPALYFLGWLSILLALAIGLYTVDRSVNKLASRTWPMTTATVLESSMYQRAGRSADWCVKLRYRYIVDGVAYTSSRTSTSVINSVGCNADKRLVDKRMQDLKSRLEMIIRYRPGNPAEAILYPADLDALDYFFLGLSAVFLFAGIKGLASPSNARPRAT